MTQLDQPLSFSTSGAGAATALRTQPAHTMLFGNTSAENSNSFSVNDGTSRRTTQATITDSSGSTSLVPGLGTERHFQVEPSRSDDSLSTRRMQQTTITPGGLIKNTRPGLLMRSALVHSWPTTPSMFAIPPSLCHWGQ